MERSTGLTLGQRDGALADGPNKKNVRFSKEQHSLLESAFRERSTLTSAEKKELADRLDLRPQQVKDWFRKARARSKVKKMEKDCEVLKECNEMLKRCSKRLREENSRLRKEIQELKTGEKCCYDFKHGGAGDNGQVSPK